MLRVEMFVIYPKSNKYDFDNYPPRSHFLSREPDSWDEFSGKKRILRSEWRKPRPRKWSGTTVIKVSMIWVQGGLDKEGSILDEKLTGNFSFWQFLSPKSHNKFYIWTGASFKRSVYERTWKNVVIPKFTKNGPSPYSSVLTFLQI